MPKTPKDKAQIFPNPYVTYCDTFNCTTRAKWFIGRPDAPYMTCLNLCDECAKDVLMLIPAELLEHVPLPEGMVLVDADRLDELEEKERLESTYRVEDAARIAMLEREVADLKFLQKADDADLKIDPGDDHEIAFDPEPLPVLNPEPEKFYCDYPGCGREFKSQQALIAHQRVHKGAGR